MGLDISSLKDFFPFGSAMLGAITGGCITYSLSRIKEKKEITKKQLESLFELQKINYKLLSSFTDCLMILDRYVLLPTKIEDYDGDKAARRIVECSNELADLYVASLSHAVHINKDIFKLVKQVHDDTRFLFVKIQKSNINEVRGIVKTYSHENRGALSTAISHITLLQNTLMQMEAEYVNRYIQ
ncbi:hypothetical protein [Bacillus sp. SH5-2]|uniref:hypothetical protein n=1 Tax=Bacillus sp. SH5-2 TaxID=2217834 RepID=UPI0011F07E47|nr:hypothetical protein [Bacillus sp. SH5-2]KAA0766382.1 hypothetical protein DN410_02785 [Bacillus sp. SH5-2]